MMKLLLLLLLLTSWSHLGSEARKCNTGVALTGHILNLDGSHRAKADVSFVHAYNCTTLDNCLEDCCSGKYGWCSVATYKNRSEEVNCLHFHCWPLSRCKFLPTTFGDSFAFPGSKPPSEEQVDEIELNLVMSRDSTTNPAKDHTRSVSARKGVENIAISRKGVSPETPYLENDLSLKNDNTTIKPRKGVEVLAEEEEIKYTNLSVINTLSDGEIEVVDYDINVTQPRIKARKGVESILSSMIFPTATMPLTTNTLIQSVGDFRSENVSTEPNSTTKELLSLLENVFEDELNASSEAIDKVPYNISLLIPLDNSDFSSGETVRFVTPSTDASFVIQSSFTSTFLDESTTSSVPQATAGIPESSLVGLNLLSTNKNIFSTAQMHPGASDSSQMKFVTVTSIPETPRSTVVKDVTSQSLVLSAFAHQEQADIIVEYELSSTDSSKDPKSNRLTSIESENERRYKSSMHLVLSLVFGLLVLVTVMGVIAKRVYDLWLRRHYHRMDFLIEGLYDGYS